MQHIYCLETDIQPEGWRRVHKTTCPYAPEEKRQHYLGVYMSCVDAVLEARRIYPQSKGCVYCCML